MHDGICFWKHVPVVAVQRPLCKAGEDRSSAVAVIPVKVDGGDFMLEREMGKFHEQQGKQPQQKEPS